MIKARGTSNAADLEDHVHSLRRENLELKKKANSQDDKTKSLLAKVQRLSEDLLRTRDLAPAAAASNARPRSFTANVRDLDDTNSLIDELRIQVKELTRTNAQVKAKMHYFRALHEAETRKRAPYDHIPPRINTYATIAVKPGLPKERSLNSPNHFTEDGGGSRAELEQMEELNAVLRSKLAEMERAAESQEKELERSAEAYQKLQQTADLDRATFQMDLVAAKKVEKELRSKVDSLDERVRALTESHNEALITSEHLNDDLKEERRRVAELEHRVKKMDVEMRENEELLEIIKDLRDEKAMLEEEQERLLSAQFSREREDEYRREIEELRARLSENTRDLSFHLDEKSEINAELRELKDKARELREEREESDRLRFEIQQELEETKDKLAFLTQNGSVDLSEVEEALSLVRLRREKGVSLDFLLEAEELYADKKVLEELRVQHADCVHELEKTRKLLHLQEHINKDYKLEVEDLNRKMEALKNGYELRLEEDARLLDLRFNKISHLEAQLKSIFPAEAQHQSVPFDDHGIELLNGQNLIEVHLEAALISDDGLYFLRRLGLDKEDANKLMTFVHYDFFDFETQVSPSGLGQRPIFNFTSRYKVFTDDFFLQYLQSQSMTLSFCLSNGTDFITIATCPMVMKELTDPDRTDRLRYYADLVSTHDGRTIIGKVDYGLRVRLPMAQAIRSFKERTVALNLLTVSDKEATSRRFRSRAETNDLMIRIIQCRGPSPAARPHVVTDTVSNSTSPLFNYLKLLPLPMTSDLDRYLRSASLEIMVLDDNEGLDDFVYGVCHVPLLPLALGEEVDGEFQLRDEYGLGKASVTVSLAWSKSYRPSFTPIITQGLERAVERRLVERQDTNSSMDSSESFTNNTDSTASRGHEERNYRERTLGSEGTDEESYSDAGSGQRIVESKRGLSSSSDPSSSSSKDSLPMDHPEVTRDLSLQTLESDAHNDRDDVSSTSRSEASGSAFSRPTRSSHSSAHSSNGSAFMKDKSSASSKSSHERKSETSSHYSESASSKKSSKQSPPISQSGSLDDLRRDRDLAHPIGASTDTLQPTASLVETPATSNTTLNTTGTSNLSLNASNMSLNASTQSLGPSLADTSSNPALHGSAGTLGSSAALSASNLSLSAPQQPLALASSMPSMAADSLESLQPTSREVAASTESLQAPSTADVSSSIQSLVQSSTESLPADMGRSTRSLVESSAESLTDGSSASLAERGPRAERGLSKKTAGGLLQSIPELHEDGRSTSSASSRTSKGSSASGKGAGSSGPSTRSSAVASARSEDSMEDEIEHLFKERKKRPPKALEGLVVSITAIRLDMRSKPVWRLLEHTRQMFISFEFLSLPPEDLETHSFPLEKSGLMPISFSKDQRALLSMLESRDTQDSTIMFTLVSEPPEGTDDDCRDLAFAKLDLQSLLPREEDDCALDIRLWDEAGEFEVGELSVIISGISLLRRLKRKGKL
ncbi:hypothetical protein DFJ73DRAFT_832463 [Zopfochytrium polystomum]|nr:hypothetical protein DFJ73DRAFT_832463 [Zopfochytrium polystomum]